MDRESSEVSQTWLHSHYHHVSHLSLFLRTTGGLAGRTSQQRHCLEQESQEALDSHLETPLCLSIMYSGELTEIPGKELVFSFISKVKVILTVGKRWSSNEIYALSARRIVCSVWATLPFNILQNHLLNSLQRGPVMSKDVHLITFHVNPALILRMVSLILSGRKGDHGPY